MAILDALATDEADDLAAVVDVRNQQAARRLLRTEILDLDGGRARVRARVHLLERDVERGLRRRLSALEDELALLRHARIEAGARDRELTRVGAQRGAVLQFLADASPLLDTVVGRPVGAAGAPNGATGWSLAEVPWAVVAEADRCYTCLRAALVEAVDNIVASELVALRVRAGQAADDIAVIELTEHDADAVGQVEAFVADVTMIGQAALRLGDRLKLAAMQGTVEHPREWLLGARLRRRDARQALDRSRAVHAALVEVERAAQLTE